MRNAKKFILFFAVLFIFAINADFIGVYKVSAFSPDFDIYSEAVFMVNLDTDLSVFRKNEFEQIHPASTTKIMTALVVLENVENLNAFVRVTNAMNYGFGENPNFTGAQAADFAVGQENITYLDCLYALLIYSACDAANILAHNVGGDESISGFVEMMNKKARSLGCYNTNFSNPHGLHQKDNYTCAYDLFLITKHALENYPQFLEIANTPRYELPSNSRNPNGIPIRNTNWLLRNEAENTHYYEFARGIKTGSIDEFYNVETGERTEGNFSLVSTATMGSYTYLIVSLGAPFYIPGTYASGAKQRAYYAYNDHNALYRWAFATIEYRMVLSEDDIVSQIPVKNGFDADRVQLKPAQDYSTLLPKNVDNTAILRVPTLTAPEIEAPVTKGEVLGYVELKLAGETLAVIDLVAARDISKSTVEDIKDTLFGIFDTVWFKALVAVLAALIIFVAVLRIINEQRYKKRIKNRNIRR
ncbi:MAG: D-alanyl-D-alanine carboxypeptidase [Oscillospiraceae bacterium]|nr:D-alanyl-D-alanine carboxypeptidase [Oscillospiraceae bacterium]